MADLKRRSDGELLKSIEERLVKIEKILTGERGTNGLLGQVQSNTQNANSVQSELREHKVDEWRRLTLAVSLAGLIIGLIIKLV